MSRVVATSVIIASATGFPFSREISVATSWRRSINQDRALRESPDSLASYLRSRHVRYAVVSPIGVYAWSYNALVAQACRDFAVVRQFSAETVLLRVRDAGENRDDLTACRALDAWHPGSKPTR